MGPRFEGPYEVLQRTGLGNYRLRLPEGDRRHSVFHESILREYHDGSDQFPSRNTLDSGIHADPPPDPSEIPQIESILGQKVLIGPNGLNFVDLLVRWKDSADSDSWIPEERVAVMAPELYAEFKLRPAPPALLLDQGSDPHPDPDHPLGTDLALPSPAAPLLLEWNPNSTAPEQPPPIPINAPQQGTGGLLARGTRSRPRMPVIQEEAIPQGRVPRSQRRRQRVARPSFPLQGEDRSDNEQL